MLVLMYHRVADLAHDPFALAVRPDRFADHVTHLQALRCVAPLLDWFTPSRAPRIAVTFDDGYVDNATTAAPLLEQAGLPVTWFLTSDRIGGDRFWWDVLTDALLGATVGPALEAQVAGRDLWLDLSTPRARSASLVVVRRRLKPLPPDVLWQEVRAVERACRPGEPDPAGRTMSPEQVRDLAGRQGAEIGAHTRTHLQLGGQSAALQRDEVLGSVEAVERLSGRPVRAFAYPFGDPVAIGDLAPSLVAEAGCLLACSTRSAVARRDDDPFLLPRLTVGDWDGREFAARVAAALSAAP